MSEAMFLCQVEEAIPRPSSADRRPVPKVTGSQFVVEAHGPRRAEHFVGAAVEVVVLCTVQLHSAQW